jgi:3-oxoacyl-[acyl-carrier protein] reductase
MNSVKGKNAIVTGGTRGIGLAIAESLLERGARVLLCARKQSEVDQTIETLRQKFGDVVYGASCDVTVYEQVQKLFAQAGGDLGGIDLLINNAGIGGFHTVEETSAQEWGNILGTNLSGVFYCCKEALPQMKVRGGGYIINIGSLAGKQAMAGAAAYCASKFGLIGFSEALMQEVRQDHIRVSYVMPGSVNTSFGRHLEQDPSTTWKLLPEDVAQVVIGLLEMDVRALPSRVELRPSEPRK